MMRRKSSKVHATWGAALASFALAGAAAAQTGGETTTRISTTPGGAEVAHSDGAVIAASAKFAAVAVWPYNDPPEFCRRENGQNSAIGSVIQGPLGDYNDGVLPVSMSITPDGQAIAYAIELTGPRTAYTPNAVLYRHGTPEGTVELVSYSFDDLDEPGEPAGSVRNVSVSADGRWVAFDSLSPDHMLPNDPLNGADPQYFTSEHVYVHDTLNGTRERISVSPTGTTGLGGSRNPEISANGRYVAFESEADYLIGSGQDTNGWTDIFVRDLQLDTTVRVSVSALGAEANDHSYSPSLSANGRFVVFFSLATNLVDGVQNTVPGLVYVHDRDVDEDGVFDEAGEVSTFPVSVDENGDFLWWCGLQSFDDTHAPDISGSGRYVLYALAPTDGQGVVNYYVRDLYTDVVTRESVATNGGYPDWGCRSASIAPDGRATVFLSAGSNLVANDTNDHNDAFVRTRCTADANGDGQVNSNDLSAFLALWQTMSPFADFNGDGVVNSNDISAHLAAFLAGC